MKKLNTRQKFVSKDLLPIFLTAAVIGVTEYILVRVFIRIYFTVYSGYFIYIIAGLVGVLCFYKLVTKNLSLAFYVVGLSILGAFLLSSLTLPFRLKFMGFDIVNVFYIALLLCLIFILFTKLSAKQPRTVLVISCALFLILPLAIYWNFKHTVNQISDIDQQRQLQRAQELSFTVYVPTYVLVGSQISGQVVGGGVISGNPYYSINYSNSDDTGYTLNEFATPSVYNPPSNCGATIPDTEDVHECTSIGHAKSGCDVYYRKMSSSTDTSAYCKIDNTLITYDSVYSDIATQSEILKIFDSLKPSNATELQKLYNISPAQ